MFATIECVLLKAFADDRIRGLLLEQARRGRWKLQNEKKDTSKYSKIEKKYKEKKNKIEEGAIEGRRNR